MLNSPTALCDPLQAMEELNRTLWLPVLPNSHDVAIDGEHAKPPVALRLDACVQIRARLLEGKLPFGEVKDAWPSAAVRAQMGAAIARLELAKYSKQNDNFAEQVLKAMLWHLDRMPQLRDAGMTPETALEAACEGFANEWEAMSAELEEAYKIFDSLGDGLRFLRWDLTKGSLHRERWDKLLAIRDLLERIPAIKQMIERLGRRQVTEQSALAKLEPVQVMREESALSFAEQAVQLPERAVETTGVQRGARVERMLPQEGVTLPHPILKWVWHARRVEHSLLTFDDEAKVMEPMPTPTPRMMQRTELRSSPRPQRGPMIVVVDTSGSMFGAPEAVAKACVLQAMRVAHAHQRPCYVIGFGGPGELFTRELSLDSEGIEALLEFMAQSFGGGTDVAEPIEHALALIEREAWRMADCLIASDGEFGVTPEVLARLRAAKAALDLRIEAVLIADRKTLGLSEIADEIYWLKDWRKYGLSVVANKDAPSSAQAAHQRASETVPVHSQNLTEMYFPNAKR